jgi:hypothetical protein
MALPEGALAVNLRRTIGDEVPRNGERMQAAFPVTERFAKMKPHAVGMLLPLSDYLVRWRL